MAISTYINDYYLTLGIREWDIKNNTLIFYQLQEPPNEIKVGVGDFSGQLEINPFTFTLNKPADSIDILWNQWNCGPLLSDNNLSYQVSIYIVSLGKWINFLPVNRAIGNGNKVALDLPGVIQPGEIQVKFILNMNRNKGYNPKTEEEVTLFFNYQAKHETVTIPKMIVSASIKDITVNAVDKKNSSISVNSMKLSTNMLQNGEMNSWDGTHAKVISPVNKAAVTLYKPFEVFGNGALHALMWLDPIEYAVKIPLFFIEDQGTVEVIFDPLTVNKNIELEVTLYDL